MHYKTSEAYRNDIDGLRSIAVLAVIIFHYGYLRNGFLGVDVFFVISGFLITGIVYNAVLKGKFSLTDFYLRRIRRIIPLSLFICAVALGYGCIVMLPDDLENLSQSVIATSFFSNNILLSVTTGNYWNVANEYKPLMHTWSLAIEEQYYLLYPLLFWLAAVRKKAVALLPVISVLALISLGLYLAPFNENQKFFWIQFRLWELAAGGIAALILKNRLLVHRWTPVCILLLLGSLFVGESLIADDLLRIIVVALTVFILCSANGESTVTRAFLANPLMVGIGKISFSLYMWHQLLLAYARYAYVDVLSFNHYAVLFVMTIVLSIVSYYLVETPFRNRKLISTKTLLVSLGLAFVALNGSAAYIYLNGGVLRDVPELGIEKGNNQRQMHAAYNSRAYKLDKDFSTTDKTRVLVVGNSFARDWINVLLESPYADALEISYIYSPANERAEQTFDKRITERASEADIVFFVDMSSAIAALHQLDNKENVWGIGTKNYGGNIGIYYNYKGDDYFAQRTHMLPGYLEREQMLSDSWAQQYLSMIDKVIDENDQVPIFSPEQKFISQDAVHLTEGGAKYYSEIFDEEFREIFKPAK